MAYSTESDRIGARVRLVGDILDDLQETMHRRRAAILAVAEVVYDPEVRVDVYANPLMTLDDDTLEGVRDAARTSRLTHPLQAPENPIPEEDRVRYLGEVRDILQSVGSDEELTPADRQHVTVLVRQLAQALEAAPMTGPQPVVTAAKAVVGDSQLNPGLWQRVAWKKWARKLAATVGGLLMLVGAYSSGKELVQDVSTLLHQPPAIAVPQHPLQASQEGSEEVHDAEVIAEPYEPE